MSADPINRTPVSIDVTVCRLSCPYCGTTAYREVTWEEFRDFRLGSWVCDLGSDGCGETHDEVEWYDDRENDR